MEQVFNATKKQVTNGTRNALWLFVTVVVLFLTGLYGTYQGLIVNSTRMGEELVQSYVADEERNLLLYQNVVKVGVTYLDQLTDQGLPMEEVSRRLFSYMNATSHALSDTELSLSLAMNGRLTYNSNAPVPEDYNYLNSVWYAQAAAVPGEVVFTDQFVCSIEHINEVVVVSVSPKTGYAVLVNLHEEDFAYRHQDLNLGENSAYYLFDGNDRLLYARAPFQADADQVEAYAEAMKQQHNAQNGENITDFEGKTRTYFSSQVSNGWSCVLTVPRSNLLVGMHQVLMSYILVLAIAMLVMVLLWRKGHQLRQHLLRVGAMVQALCNSFYAIYRVDIKNGQYEVLKRSRDNTIHLSRKGRYQDMLTAFAVDMDRETAQEFTSCFSLEHLSRLAHDRVKDFGGDFQRSTVGGTRWVNVNVIVDEPLSQDEALLAFRLVDADRQQQHSRLVKEAMEAADAHERAQRQFFASMSHDMRTPLNIILGMNQLSARPDCTQEKRAECAREIDHSGRQLLHLINDVLDLSRMEQGQLSLEKHAFDLCQALADDVAPFQSQAEQQGKVFNFHMDVERPLVLGDKVRLAQIMDNLLSNALKYTLPGDSISVTLSQAGADNKNYLFVVEDTGIGMSQEFLKKLYEPYARERRFGANSAVGSGLGLTIVKNLVSQKGGDISVESAPGKGTCFRVTLPFARPKAAPASEDKPDKPSAAAPGYSLGGKHVLVAEDNDFNRDILTELLEEEGAVVTGAADGQEAVEVFSASAPFAFDVILMDLQMPRMDGCQAAQAIRALDRPDAKSVFILALTANTFAEDMGRSVKAGMDAHLSKPASLSIICQTLSRLTIKRQGDSTATNK